MFGYNLDSKLYTITDNKISRRLDRRTFRKGYQHMYSEGS